MLVSSYIYVYIYISCTSWCSRYPSIHRVLYIPGGAGFLPINSIISILKKFSKYGYTQRLRIVSDWFSVSWKWWCLFGSTPPTLKLWMKTTLFNPPWNCHYRMGVFIYLWNLKFYTTGFWLWLFIWVNPWFYSEGSRKKIIISTFFLLIL